MAAEKKILYAQYRAAQKEMQEDVAVKGNVDHLPGITEAPKIREMTQPLGAPAPDFWTFRPEVAFGVPAPTSIQGMYTLELLAGFVDIDTNMVYNKIHYGMEGRI